LSDLDHALAFNPRLAEAWDYRGAIWFAKQDFTPAIADFNEALGLSTRGWPTLTAAAALRGWRKTSWTKLKPTSRAGRDTEA
jgi:lipoprotein NlpI